MFSFVQLGAYLIVCREGVFSNVYRSRVSAEGGALFIRVSGKAPTYSFAGRGHFPMCVVLF